MIERRAPPGTPDWTIMSQGEIGRERGTDGKHSIVLVAFSPALALQSTSATPLGGSIGRDAIFPIEYPWAVNRRAREDGR